MRGTDELAKDVAVGSTATAIDDTSRVAYVEILDDEKGPSCARSCAEPLPGLLPMASLSSGS